MAILYLTTFQLVDVCVISTFWPLCILLLRTFVYKSACAHMFSVLPGISLGVELLDRMVILFNLLKKCQVPRAAAPFYSLTSSR